MSGTHMMQSCVQQSDMVCLQARGPRRVQCYALRIQVGMHTLLGDMAL